MTQRARSHSSGLAGLLNRRDLLRIGSLGVGATALSASLLHAGEGSSPKGKAKSIIFLWMAGGVTHIDSFDPKPDAPVEVRGTLNETPTATPGLRFCETMPEMAKVADQITLVRSYSHDSNDHLLSQVYTLSGRKVDRTRLFSEPNLGSVFSHLHGPRNGLPAYIAVPGITRPGPPPHNFFLPGWLGSHHAPYCLGGLPEEPDFTASPQQSNPPAEYDEQLTPKSLSLGRDMDVERLANRAELRRFFDRALTGLERDQTLAAVDAKYRSALRLLMTPEVRGAFAIDDEPDAVRQAYGRTKIGGRCLMARRLVEAGARFVMVDYGYDPDYGNVWDNHNAASQNHPPLMEMVKRGYHLAGMDRAFAALLGDLQDRGLLDSTLVVFLTEFGRTPIINARGGRDHWGAAGSMFFAGGGAARGRVIGATDKTAAKPLGRGYTPADIAATICSAAGIDHSSTIYDIFDRPRAILDSGRVIPGVLS